MGLAGPSGLLRHRLKGDRRLARPGAALRHRLKGDWRLARPGAPLAAAPRMTMPSQVDDEGRGGGGGEWLGVGSGGGGGLKEQRGGGQVLQVLGRWMGWGIEGT